MWSCLNIAYLGLRPIEIEHIWNDRPVEFYRRTKDAIRTFSGITESTMYRDDGWHFLLLGRFVERAQLVAALVDAQLAVFSSDDPHVESAWRSLLQICEAQVAYSHLHSLVFEPSSVVDFLVSDPRLSYSIRYALTQISDALNTVTDDPLTCSPPTDGGRGTHFPRNGRVMIQSSNPERFFKPLIDKGCLGRAQTAIQPAGNRRETGSLKTAPTATHRCSHSGIAPGQPSVLPRISGRFRRGRPGAPGNETRLEARWRPACG